MLKARIVRVHFQEEITDVEFTVIDAAKSQITALRRVETTEAYFVQDTIEAKPAGAGRGGYFGSRGRAVVRNPSATRNARADSRTDN